MNIAKSDGHIKPIVHKAMVWGLRGKVFSQWTTRTFQMKSEGAALIAQGKVSEGAALKSFGKILGNACFGVSAQRDYRNGFSFVRTNADLMDFYKNNKWLDTINAERYAAKLDSVLVMKGEPLDVDDNIMTSKPRYMGSFVLAYSRQRVNTLVNAANPYNRTSETDEKGVLKSLSYQPYYGDTDSLLLPSRCEEFLLTHFGKDEAGKLGDDLNAGASDVEKKMKNGIAPSGAPMFMKVVQGYFVAPKTYTVQYLRADNTLDSKVKAKGIPNSKSNDIKVEYCKANGDKVTKTKFEFEDFEAVQQQLNNSDFKGITISMTNNFAKRGTKVFPKDRANMPELFTISASYLSRTIFRKPYSGRKQLSEGSPITVPHGFNEYSLD
jgi:hypothetical protein